MKTSPNRGEKYSPSKFKRLLGVALISLSVFGIVFATIKLSPRESNKQEPEQQATEFVTVQIVTKDRTEFMRAYKVEVEGKPYYATPTTHGFWTLVPR